MEKQAENYIFPFLWMHGETEQVLREYVNVIYNSNIRAFCVESRPHPDFCGEGWWHDMDILINEAKKLGMQIWILDDSHFPTGYANGALESAEEELCRQSLVYQKLGQKKQGETLELSLDEYKEAGPWTPNLNESYTMDMEKVRHFTDDRLLGIVALKESGKDASDILTISTGGQTSGTIHMVMPEGTWNIYVLHLTRNRGPHRNYINMMNYASCHKLIEAVYEPHFAHYEEEFGKTIAGFFSDEPELGNGHLYESGKHIYELDDQPWSNEVEACLKEQFGEAYTQMLPLLWEQDFAEEYKAKIRTAYMNSVTGAVKRDFSEQLGQWCREHHVSYIGHLIEDNNQHTRTASSLGHYFRGMFGQDMAGIDDIGGQVLPQGEWNGPYGLMGEPRNGEFYHFVLGKLASSMAAIDPKKKGNSMCEIFGAYGWEEGVRLEKYLVDHFMVRGINHFVPHAFSPREFPDPDCPPHFYAHGHNPQYRHFGELMRYTNQVCSMISGGRHVAHVAVLYNAEAEWSGKYMELEKPARILTEMQMDFDFLPADVFTDKEAYKTKIGKDLIVNTQIYELLLIPYMQFLPQKVIEALKELQEKGCKICFIDGFPDGNCEGELLPEENWNRYSCVELSKLNTILRENISKSILLLPHDKNIRVLEYKKKDTIYMLVNEGTDSYEGEILIPTQGECYCYDAYFNTAHKVKKCEENGVSRVAVTLLPLHSTFLIFGELPSEAENEKTVSINQKVCNISENWKRSLCKSIDYPNGFGETQLVTMPDTLAKEQPEFSGIIAYEKAFEGEELGENPVITITDAYEGVELFVNGESLGIQIVPPFHYELKPWIIPGKNNIRIEVATTLERQMAKQPDPIRMYLGLGEKIPTCPSGINGDILLEQKQ